MKTFKLSISTPIGKNFETEDAVMINAHILEGRIGVLANRSPLVSSLKVSRFSVQMADNSEIHGVVDGGVFSVTKEGVTILTKRFKLAHEIDIEQAKQELEDIEKELQKDVKDAAQKSLAERHVFAELKLEVAKMK